MDASPQTPTSLRWIVLGLVVVAFLCTRITAPFMPDPLTSVFHRPTTQLSSTSLANHWAMWGGDLQQRRYVAEAPRQPEGRRAWSMTLGTPTRSVPVVVDDVLYIGGHFTLLALDAHTGHRAGRYARRVPSIRLRLSLETSCTSACKTGVSWRWTAARARPGGSSRCRTRLLARPL